MNSDVILDTLPAHLFRLDIDGNILEFHITPNIQSHPQPKAIGDRLDNFLSPVTASLYLDWIKRLDTSSSPISFGYAIE